jgi:hypothetical protein
VGRRAALCQGLASSVRSAYGHEVQTVRDEKAEKEDDCWNPETYGGWMLARQFTVSFEGWHEEFATESEALGCFAFGLSSDCRLVIVFRGNVETQWIVERLDEGKWIEDSATGLLWQPFWRQARREYRQNRIVRYPICKLGR